MARRNAKPSRPPARPAAVAAAAPAPPLAGYHVLVCVTGGIAAYKTATLVSELVQAGCQVTAALTRNARRFVGPTTFQALTGRPVYTSTWHAPHAHDLHHLSLSEQADLILVAPATANILGKVANGLADDLVSTLLLAAECPVLFAPAMNTRMWEHPAVRRNVRFLKKSGATFVGPEQGWLACGAVGTGRMSEPATILAAVRAALLQRPPRGTAAAPSST